MCIVSETIKFCTCVTGSVDEMEHYWVLYRYTKSEENYTIIGIPVFPPAFLEPDVQKTETILLNRLNEADAFDTPILFKPKDWLEVVLYNLSPKPAKRMEFTFKYKGKKWVIDTLDPFKQNGEYQKFRVGKFE